MACYSPFSMIVSGVSRRLPCNTCLGCRIDYSRMWALRCVHESKLFDDNCFVTLTYDNDHIKMGRERPSLFKRDLQLFFKRLRKHFDVRYFACGEYGDTTHRPHYHACLFGLDFKDKVLYSRSNGNDLFRSDTLDRLWGNGNCLIGAMSAESAAYVARYCLKKLSVDFKHYFKDEGIEPEFLAMSRRPGIGRGYFDMFNSDFFVVDKCITSSGVYSVPRYYSDILRVIDNDLFVHVKAMRDERKRKVELFERMPKRLSVKAAVKAAQIKALKRPF